MKKFRKRKTDKIKSVFFPIIFNYEVKIVFTHSLEKSFKKFEHTRDSNLSTRPSIRGCAVHVNDREMSYIFILYGESAGVMVHEAYHVIRHMFEEHNIEMSNENVAHHLGYLVDEIVELAQK